MCYRAALLLALLCGLRLGEVGELRLSDVDWKNNTIDISRALIYTPQTGSYAGGTKTEAGERLISLPPGMMAVLHETREYQKEVQTWAGDLWKGEGWIVHGWNGARLHHDTPSKWFRRFADANGFEGVRFHDLRHPYVKHTTKKYNSEKKKTQATKMDLIAWVFRFCIFNYSKRSWIL